MPSPARVGAPSAAPPTRSSSTRKGDQPLEAEAQHLAALRLVLGQVAQLDDQRARPGVRQDQRSGVEAPPAAREQEPERLLERTAVEPDAASERSVPERPLGERDGVVLAEFEPVATLAHERRVAQLAAGHREDVRRHRHRVETRGAPNPRR